MGLVGVCKGTLAVFESGAPGNRWDVEAAGEIVRVAGGTTAKAAWETAVAVVMMHEVEPQRFASERSYRTQLGRRVRQLVLANRVSYVSKGGGTPKVVYRDPSPRGAVMTGDLLAATFGVAGVWLAGQDRAEADAKAAERAAFYTALTEVAPGAAA